MPVRAEPAFRPSFLRPATYVAASAFGAMLAGMFVWGCSLDFTVRPDPGEAGSAIDGAPDGSDSAPTGDSGTNDAPVDVVVISDASCDALFVAADQARVEARACELAKGHCAEKEMGLCCETFVAQKDSGATAKFRAAVADFKAKGCNAGCTGCTGLPVVGGCVQQGGKFECSP
jgi:hypothetical protein